MRGHMHEGLHRGLGLVRAKFGFTAYPLRALTSDSPLGEFVAKLDFKFGAIQSAFALGLRNEELSPLLFEPVRDFIWHKGRRGEDELQAIDAGQLFLQRFEGIDREARGSDLQTGARLDRIF